MTSKEQTIKRIENQKEKIKEHQKEYGRVGLFDKLELKYLESVLKDLEVLEILKTMMRQNEVTLTPKEIWNISNDEIEKLKEWFNNDK
jgi:hypothetical protein